MPVDVRNGTTAPVLPEATPLVGVNNIPLLAYQPHYLHDFMVGGFTIDHTSVPLEDGKRLAYAGDVFRRDDATGKYKLAAANDDGTGSKYVMLPHNRDVTAGDQSSNALLRSQHVNKGALRRPIPAALVGNGKDFQYMFASNVDTRG